MIRRQLQFRVLTETTTGSRLAGLREIAFPEWMGDAPCADHDPEIWFPTASSGQQPERRMARLSQDAKAVCQGCPVRIECLEYAFETDQRHGVWGGLDEYERRQLKARRPARRS